MTRRVVYRGSLRFPYGFHTGDGRRLGAVDQPVLRTPDGGVALAGTSLAGVLRSDLGRLLRATGGQAHSPGSPACACVVCHLLGPEAPPGRRGDDGAEATLRASKLHVSGGTAAGRPAIVVRDHVGIDRRTRTAADRRKFDAERVEGGVAFPFELRADHLEEDERILLEASLRRLARGWLFLGGKSGSGAGRAELAGLTRREWNLGDPKTLVDYLLAEGDDSATGAVELVGPASAAWAQGCELAPAASPVGDKPESPPADWAQLRLRLELEFPWGFLVNAPPDALAVGYDHAYARSGADGAPVLPGSALRGALRSRAEQILRTFGGFRAACDLNRSGRKDDGEPASPDAPAGSCHERLDALAEQLGTQGRLLDPAVERERLCCACRVFGSGRLASPVKVTDFLPVEGGSGSEKGQEFVAVDRFTGGAAPGLKFDAQARTGVTLAGEIHLEIGPGRLEPWALGLLALVLRDLLWGDVPLGFGSGKGFNEVRARLAGVDRFWLMPPTALAGLGLDPAPGERQGSIDGPADDPAGLAGAAGPALAERLRAWVEELHLELAKSDVQAKDDAGSAPAEAAP